MIRISIDTIQKWIDASIYGCDNPEIKIDGVSIDSRQVKMGTLYIPILGARVDGHSFIEDVKKQGASASFWQKDHQPYPQGIPLILVDDTLEAMQKLAKAYIDSIDPIVIGITGSNGKTSCKDMMQSVCSMKYKSQCTQGNRNSEYGLPLTIFDLEPDTEVAILEMGLERPGDLELLCSIAQPHYSVITSIGSAHMEAFGNKDEIAKGKLEILANTRPGGYFYYHKDSESIERVIEEIEREKNIEIYSFGTRAEIEIEGDISHYEDGISFIPKGWDKKVSLPVLGDFQAMNSLPVIAIATELGLTHEQIIEGLEKMKLTKMRSVRKVIGNASILDDTYKSNPESAKAAIDTLMTMPAQTHIAVLADMLDLGPEENQLHAQVGSYAKQVGVDKVYCLGELSKHTAQAFNGQWFETKEELIQQLKEEIQTPCAILVKGSRAMQMDTIISELEGETI